MNKVLPISAAAAALFALAACENKVQEVDGRAPDPMASQLANAAPVELPPAVTASKSLRCGDNSLLFVDFFAGDKQVQVGTEKGGPKTMLKAPEAGEAFVADGGWKLTGDQKNVDVTIPGKGSKSCHA